MLIQIFLFRMVAKLKTPASKLFQIILIITLVLIYGSSQKYVRRFLRIPKIFDTVESSDSELLRMLTPQSKFSNVWWWDGIITNQFDQSGYDLNIDEWAIRTFVGYRKGHKVRFIHTLTEYFTSPTELNLEPMWEGYGVDIVENKIPISIPFNSTFLPPVCYTGFQDPETKVTRCVLVREQGNLHERIDLDIYSETSTEMLSEFVNNIVSAFEDKEVKIE